MTTMQGRRLPDATEGKQYHWSKGDYGKIDGVWWIRPPSGSMGRIDLHTVVEHEDGTISVSPSILLEGMPDESGVGNTVIWHGYLEHGVWREA